jgi:hypothetical protein
MIRAVARSLWIWPVAALPLTGQVVTPPPGSRIAITAPGTPPPAGLTFMSASAMPLNVVDYGAQCDGRTDDTRAISAALTAAAITTVTAQGIGSQAVQLPPGVCIISKTLIVQNQVVLLGMGRSVSEIKAGPEWTNPSPNALVRLGDNTAPVFGARVENLNINCNGIAGTIGLYGQGIQDQSGAVNVLFRAFGVAGVQTRGGTYRGVTTNNAYELIHTEAMNGVSGVGIGYDLDGGPGGATFSPTLIGLSASNGSFPGRKAPAGIKLQNGPFYLWRVGSEYYIAGIQFATGGYGAVFGLSGNFNTDGLLIQQTGVQGFGLANGGGTNVVNDAVNSVKIPVSANLVPAYLGAGFQSVATSLVLGRKTLAYGATVTPNLSSGNFFTVAVTNTSAWKLANPTGYAPTSGSAAAQEWTLDVYNNSGGVMGAVATGTAYKLTGAFVAPANGFHRMYRFYWDGFFWRELMRSPADQAN